MICVVSNLYKNPKEMESTRLLIYTLWMLIFPELFTVFHEGEAAYAVKRFTGLYTGPYFDPTTTTNITTQLGTHAYIPCKIKQLGNKSVSWIRRRDAHILTVDRYTFIADDRFQAFFVEATDTWTLQVKYVQARDAGQYECQVSTEPKMSHFINLNVVVPKIEIEGESDIYVKRGSTVQLKCVITQSLEEPAYIFWYHDGERVLKYDQSAIDIRMSRKGTDTTISTMTIFRTRPEDAGNYTCSPSNLDSASAYLHVINGKFVVQLDKRSAGDSLAPGAGAAGSGGGDDGIVGGPRTPQQVAAQRRLQQTQAQVDEVVDIMKTNVEKVLERDQKLSELDDRADALQQGASQFEQQAGKLKRKFWLQNLKMMIIMGVIGLVILIIIIMKFMPDTPAAPPAIQYAPALPPPPPPATGAGGAAGAEHQAG